MLLIFVNSGASFVALIINSKLHSRLPYLINWYGCFAYMAECSNRIYGVAIWGNPIARLFNGRGYIELRRLAIDDSAPKNTATRMIGWMLRQLRDTKKYTKAISYQDTSVHEGTIYKASGWKIGGTRRGGTDAWTDKYRKRNKCPADGIKIRWEYDLK